jgi:hypothetical protein
MLSKILVRSGLSRLLWIKDVVSHRLDDCVLELYGLLCLDLNFTLLLLAHCFRASCLRPRRFRSRLPCSNLSRVSRFRLLVNPLASILFYSLLDPRGRRSPLGANRTASKQRRLSRNRTPVGSIPIRNIAIGAQLYSSQSLKTTQGASAMLVPGRVPLNLLLQCLGLVFGLTGAIRLSTSITRDKRLDCLLLSRIKIQLSLTPQATFRRPTRTAPHWPPARLFIYTNLFCLCQAVMFSACCRAPHSCSRLD